MGQNFLQDEEVARWIGDQVQPDGADLVVEIGPGMGALTKHLVGRPKKLILIEKDSQLAPELQAQFEGRDDVEIIHDDERYLLDFKNARTETTHSSAK